MQKSETVFLFGLGGLGFNALQIVHSAIGARIIVSDVRSERVEAAAKLGVPQKDIVPVGKSVQEFVKENGLQGKIDTVLDFVGEKQTFEDGQHIGLSNFFVALHKKNRKCLSDQNIMCSPHSRQNRLRRHALSRQCHPYENRCQEAASLYLLLWWTEARPGRATATDGGRDDYAAGGRSEVGRFPASLAGSGRREDKSANGFESL